MEHPQQSSKYLLCLCRPKRIQTQSGTTSILTWSASLQIQIHVAKPFETYLELEVGNQNTAYQTYRLAEEQELSKLLDQEGKPCGLPLGHPDLPLHKPTFLCSLLHHCDILEQVFGFQFPHSSSVYCCYSWAVTSL